MYPTLRIRQQADDQANADGVPTPCFRVIPLISMEEPPLHTSQHPFCWDNSCPCHEDTDLIAVVHQQYLDGLLTQEEATRTTTGKML
jgi:hypothetical protein